MVFGACQLQEKCQEMRIQLYTTSADLTKTVDTVNLKGLWKIMQKFGCPERFTHMVRPLHDGMLARVTDNGAISEAAAVANGMKQGCALVPTLFSLIFSVMLMDTYRDEWLGTRIDHRTDGHLLDNRQMKAPTPLSTANVHDLLIANVCALNNTTKEGTQRSMDFLAAGCAYFGLTISTNKMVVMQIHHPTCSTSLLLESLWTATNSKS
nr:unnamed protein product [Spirometra erinaceieuropaei]